MFEFQTAMSELTGLPLSSAGLYEGPSTVASAGYLAIAATKRRRFVVSRGLHPDSRETLRTYSRGYPADVDEVGLADGVTDRRRARRRGRRGDRRRLRPVPELPRRRRGPRAARRDRPRSRRAAGRRLRPDRARHPADRPATAASTSPSARASRSATGSTTAARRSASSARPRSRSGGCPVESPARPPTSTAAAASSSPCRPASSTSAARRRRTTSARRRRSTRSRRMIYLSWLGKRGLVELGELLARRTAYARERLTVDRRSRGAPRRPGRPRVRDPRSTRRSTRSSSTAPSAASPPGVPLGAEYGESGLLVAITERRTRAQIERLAEALGEGVAAHRAAGDEGPRTGSGGGRMSAEAASLRRPRASPRPRCSATARRRSTSARSRAGGPRRSPAPGCRRRRSTS